MPPFDNDAVAKGLAQPNVRIDATVARSEAWSLSSRTAASGAIVATFSQALGSFLLQLLALRYLGIDGLGRYAVLFGFIIIATSITSGLIGDSLTVLDRSRSTVRAGLQAWLGVVAGSIGLVLGVGYALVGSRGAADPTLFGVAGALFVVEDSLRRLLMASLRFWSVVIVDVAVLITSVGLVLAVASTHVSSMTDFLLALVAGQCVGIVCAVGRLPPSERWIAKRVVRDLRIVWSYGSWRAIQQMLRPLLLNAVRLIVTVAAGVTAYGELEAARLYIAPAMLVVGGVAAYLFASYARDRSMPLVVLRRRADHTVIGLAVVTFLLGAVAIGLVPSLGRLIIGEDGVLDPVAVLGWTAYAAATAAVTPYGSLAAVRGRQAQVLFVRAAESMLSVVLVVATVGIDGTSSLVPFALAVASLASGLAIRFLLLGEQSSDTDSITAPLIDTTNDK